MSEENEGTILRVQLPQDVLDHRIYTVTEFKKLIGIGNCSCAVAGTESQAGNSYAKLVLDEGCPAHGEQFKTFLQQEDNPKEHQLKRMRAEDDGPLYPDEENE